MAQNKRNIAEYDFWTPKNNASVWCGQLGTREGLALVGQLLEEILEGVSNKCFDLVGQLAHNSLPFALMGEGRANQGPEKCGREARVCV
jgi:hypothetical protein